MVQWVVDMLDNLVKEKFTGNIQINMFRGGISNVTKTESFKPQPKE